MWVITAKVGVIREASSISRLLAAAKLQSAPGAVNPCYATFSVGVVQVSTILTDLHQD